MRINSKDCKKGGCTLYPCNRIRCDYKLAICDNKWLIVKGTTAERLNKQMKSQLYKEYYKQTLQM